MANTGDSEQPRENRLQPIDRSAELLPFHRAQQLTRCSLYWLPASAFPLPEHELTWTQPFLDHFAALLESQFGRGCEVFLQFKAAQEEPLLTPFLRSSRSFIPITGLSRRPGKPVPPPPSKQDIDDVRHGRKAVTMH